MIFKNDTNTYCCLILLTTHHLTFCEWWKTFKNILSCFLFQCSLKITWNTPTRLHEKIKTMRIDLYLEQHFCLKRKNRHIKTDFAFTLVGSLTTCNQVKISMAILISSRVTLTLYDRVLEMISAVYWLSSTRVGWFTMSVGKLWHCTTFQLMNGLT